MRELESKSADLVAENERLKAELSKHEAVPQYKEARRAEVAVLHDQLTTTRTALAAAEADNEWLRLLLEDVAIAPLVSDFGLPKYGISISEMQAIQQALSQPRDDSALREMIASVYEECAKVCEETGKYAAFSAEVYADAIRALAEKAKGE